MRGTADLRRRILNRTARIAVVGQGYVGLSLACVGAEAGFEVTGIDIDARRVAELSEGRAVVAGVDEEAFRSAYLTGRLTFDVTAAPIARSHLIFVCVPTPLRDRTPDLSYIDGACADVAAHLAPGSLVVLESTTYPGTTEERVKPMLERSGMVAGRDFLLAYSPERIDPGNGEFGLRDMPRVVGGLSAESTGMASPCCTSSSWTKSSRSRPVAWPNSRSSSRTLSDT